MLLNKCDVLGGADTAFVLAFSIIMLNTDLHNPAIPDDRRMTKAIFRRQVEGIANGGNLPDDYLDAIYDRIKKHPISLKVPPEDLMPLPPTRPLFFTLFAFFLLPPLVFIAALLLFPLDHWLFQVLRRGCS